MSGRTDTEDDGPSRIGSVDERVAVHHLPRAAEIDRFLLTPARAVAPTIFYGAPALHNGMGRVSGTGSDCRPNQKAMAPDSLESSGEGGNQGASVESLCLTTSSCGRVRQTRWFYGFWSDSASGGSTSQSAFKIVSGGTM